MKSFIRNLSTTVEFCIVVSLWLDPLLINGCFLLPKFLHSGLWEIDNAFMIRGAILQIMALAVLIWIGNIRDWPPSKLGFKISWKGTGGGMLLAGVSYAATYGVWTLCELTIRQIHPDFVVSCLAIPVIISTMIINSVFEEVIEAGYFIRTFSRFGMWFTILTGAFLRMLYHLPLLRIEALLGILVTALMLEYAYWRWRQLWPLILAHTLRNFYFFFFAVHYAT